MTGNPWTHPNPNNTVDQKLSRIETRLDTIQESLDRLFSLLEHSPEPEALELRLDALCNTVAGPGGQVQPGRLILKGPEATSYLQALGEATIVPLKHMPPWTHMALADKAWWLLQMH